jgi:translation initiation factor 2 subunit 2
MDYNELLERGMKNMPKQASEGERFEIKKAITQKDGRKTIIVNFLEVAKSLRRDPNHLLKFLLKELATKGDYSGQRLTVLGNFTADHINKKIDIYVGSFIVCPECGKPDTQLFKEGKFTIMKCEACGARSTTSKI